MKTQRKKTKLSRKEICGIKGNRKIKMKGKPKTNTVLEKSSSNTDVTFKTVFQLRKYFFSLHFHCFYLLTFFYPLKLCSTIFMQKDHFSWICSCLKCTRYKDRFLCHSDVCYLRRSYIICILMHKLLYTDFQVLAKIFPV